MIATFAPMILWLAPMNAGFAPTIAAFALGIFSKTHQSSLTLKGGSTAFPKPLSPQGTGDVSTALSIVFTTPSVPLVGDRNGAQTASL